MRAGSIALLFSRISNWFLELQILLFRDFPVTQNSLWKSLRSKNTFAEAGFRLVRNLQGEKQADSAESSTTRLFGTGERPVIR
jgi:hypothetical protein